MACEYHFNKSQQRPEYYSECIQSVLRYIRDVIGYQVIEFDESLSRSDEQATFGRIDYLKKTISSNCFCAGCILLTYLHEAGHARHYEIVGDPVEQGIVPVEEREAMAEKYGREISDELGFELTEEWLVSEQDPNKRIEEEDDK